MHETSVEKEKDEEINFELTRSRKSLRKDSRLSSTDKKQEITHKCIQDLK
jgi:hypothetical protein